MQHPAIAGVTWTTERAFRAFHQQKGWVVLQPSTNHVYSLNDVTVDGGATLTSLSGAEIRSADTLRVVSGGTLSAEGTTFAALTGYSWSGIDVLAGATATFTDSVFTGATIAVEANPDWALGGQYAEVSISGSSFFGNGFDVFNGPKDVPWGSAVNAESPFIVSSHLHTCVPVVPDPKKPPYERRIWDVEGDGRQDDPACLQGYTDFSGHP